MVPERPTVLITPGFRFLAHSTARFLICRALEKAHNAPMRVLIVGCSYIGMAIGERLAIQGHKVFGLRRHEGASGELKPLGIESLVGDVTQLETLTRLPGDYDGVVNCVSASGGGEEEYRAIYLEGTRNLIKWLSPKPPRKFVYTSSTSVYGQNDGSLVTESSPAEPAADTAKVLTQTEQALIEAAHQRQFPAVILRVAGIYGPGRGYWFKQLLQGTATIEGCGERILNMIHRDDVAGAIIAALEDGRVGEIYNAVDNEPVSQFEFFKWFSAQLGKEIPPLTAEDLQNPRKRGITNKRISNAKLKAELGYEFKYPTFREGSRQFLAGAL
jgi:nucleoside-diphosphate-sugar epimerase